MSFWQGLSSATAPANPVLPTRKDEDWRYVSLKFLESWNFKPALRDQIDLLPASKLDEIVVADGYVVGEAPQGLKLEIIQRDVAPSRDFQDWFASLEAEKAKIKAGTDLFEDLNRLRFPEGIFLDIPDGTMPVNPVLVRWVTTSNLGTRYPRLWVRVGRRAKLILAECFESSSVTDALVLPVADIELCETAKLEYTRVAKGSLLNAQIARTRILLKRDSTLESLSLAMGSRLVRHNLDVYMCEAGAAARLHGLSYTGGSQIVDHHTSVDHVVGRCQTNQLYKSVLAGQSRAVFNGRVVIRHEAQQANSEQLNQNLLLSPTAEVDSKPQLEIWADDVKATHGSTIGQLNEEEIFYFQSRAIPRSQAEMMIRKGFTRDLLMQVSDDRVRDWLTDLQTEADQRLMP